MRRGQLEMAQVIGILFVIAVALVLFTFWYRWNASVAGANTVENCRLSAQNLAFLWIDVPDEDFHLTSLDCQRRSILFTGKDVRLLTGASAASGDRPEGTRMQYYDPDRRTSKSTYTELTPTIVNSVVASELATCWYQFLEGKLYFSNEVDPNNNKFNCFTCSEIRFAPEVKEQAAQIGTESFVTFLREERSRPYPRSVGGGNPPTYEQYLYTSSHLCDHKESSELPFYANWFGTFVEWFDEEERRACEEQFYEKVLLGGEDNAEIRSLNDAPNDATAIMHFAYDGIDVSRDYFVMFIQLGADLGEIEEGRHKGKPTGTTYAPVLLPISEYGKEMPDGRKFQCQRFLG